MRFSSSYRCASQRLNSIRIPANVAVQVLTFIFFVFVLCLLPSTASGQANVTTSTQIWDLPVSGPPTTNVLLQGVGFDPLTAIDVYFDSTVLTSTTTDKNGAFGNGVITATGATWTRLQVPSTALPGQHTITAKEHSGQKSAQKTFRVQTDWSQLQFGPDHTGLNPYENVLSLETVGNLTTRWKYTGAAAIDGQPVVANGVVYVAAHQSDLYALNADTGALLWSYPQAVAYNSPAAANGAVYFVAYDAQPYQLYLCALNANTGALLWKYMLGDDYTTNGPTVVANGIVYIARQNSAEVDALDAGTGTLLWTAPVFTSGVAVASGVAYLGARDLYALNARTGALLWKFPGTKYGFETPFVANGVVYAVEGNNAYLYAVDASTGALLWIYTPGYSIWGSPAVGNGVLYVTGGETVYALNALTSDLLWKSPIPDVPTALVLANGVVYVASGYSESLYALSASTGALVWSYPLGASWVNAPAVVNGAVYVGDNDGNVYALGLPNQQMSAKFSPPERPDPARLTPDWNLQPSAAVTSRK